MLHDWVTTVDHKKIGIMYVVMAVVFLVIGGVRSDADALAACHSAQHADRTRSVQSALHDPRHDDGVLHGHADLDRHRQLSRSADDRGPRHGLSAAERDGLLGHAVRRAAGLFQLSDRRGAGDRLVCLCAAHRAHLRPQRRDRLLGPGADRQRHGDDRRRREFHRDDFGHAGPRDGAAQGAVLRLDDALDLGADRDRACRR